MSEKWVAILVGLFSLTFTSKAITITVDEVDVPHVFSYNVWWGAEATAPHEVAPITVVTGLKFSDYAGHVYDISLAVSASETEYFDKTGVYLGRNIRTDILFKGNALPYRNVIYGVGVFFEFPAGSNGAFELATINNNTQPIPSPTVEPTADGLGAHIEYRYLPPLYPPHVPDTGGTAALLAFGLIGCVYAKRYAVSARC